MKEYDVIIVGGGIHGAGVLQAAAAAGHSALLVEKRELASGTSSRSSKLIHGGLRYLESGQFSLVRESLRERAVHLRIAPDLLHLKSFFIPGLRVLPAASEKAFDRSRETIFTADRDPHPRVLGIYGGKLTGWRAAAAHVLTRISPSLSAKPRRAATDQLVLRSTL
jgi:glycerol-3-phosphate dehydrogenase